MYIIETYILYLINKKSMDVFLCYFNISRDEIPSILLIINLILIPTMKQRDF